MLKINEIFFSIQGESSFVGLPCVFVRLATCNLRCFYCDSTYTFSEGLYMDIDKIISIVNSFNCNLIEITGGEPLFQKETEQLIFLLLEKGKTVLLETNGTLPIHYIDKRTNIILDIKTPSSKMENQNLFSNLQFLKSTDEIKFVIGSEEDYCWAKNIILDFDLINKNKILMGCVFGNLKPVELVNWILRDNLNIRFQLQLHKYIWDPNMRGV